jgi:hypothetical protein
VVSVILNPSVDVLQLCLGRGQGSQEIALIDEAPKTAGPPCMIEDRQQVGPVQLVAERAAGNLRLAQAEHDDTVIGRFDLMHPHRGAGYHKGRLQRWQARRLPPDQGGADVRGHPAPIRAAQAPRRAKDLEARSCRRLVIPGRREAEMAAEADMHLIAALLQIGQSERPARECRGHQHHVQVIAGRVAVPEGQPGDAARR